jgi:hypothetical protein
MLRGFVPGFAVNGYPQPRDAGNLGVPPAHASVGGTIVAVATVLALVAGIAAARRIVLVRVLLVVLLGALLGMYLLARRHQWPFIWGRTSLFLLPLGYVVLAAGLSELWRWLRTSAAMALRSGAGWQRLAAAFTTACLAGGLLLSAAAGVVVTRVAARDLHGMTETLPRANTGLRDVGELVRSGARPGDLVVFELQGRPLTYYLLYHRGSAGPASTPVRAGDVASVNQFDSPQTIDFVRHHAGAGQVWIFQYVGVGARAYQDEVAAMRHIGYRPQQVTHVPSTGVLTRYRRAGTR